VWPAGLEAPGLLLKCPVSSLCLLCHSFLILAAPGFELRALHLLGPSSSSFCFRDFLDRVSCFCPGVAWMASCCPTGSWDDRHKPPGPRVLIETRSEAFFFPSWPQTTILPMSASQLAGITGVSHHAWPYVLPPNNTE
jgi:hypothetical protein